MRGKLHEWYQQLHAIRTNSEEPRDISFREFLSEKGQAAKDSQALTPERVFYELGLNWKTIKFNELEKDPDGFFLAAEFIRESIDRGMHGMTLREQIKGEELLKALYSQAAITTDPSARYVTPEYFTPVIMRGVVQGEYWDQLIRADVTVPQTDVNMPSLSLSDAQLEERTQGATIREGTVVYGKKLVSIKERSKGIYIVDEALKYNRLDLLAGFFEDLGSELGSGLNGEAVRILRDGDQANGSEAALVIGVATAGTLAYKDILRVMVRMGMIARPISQVVAGEEMAIEWEDLAEVKTNQNSGNKLLPTITFGVVRPQNWGLFPAFNIPANKLLFNDPNKAMVALTAAPLTLEQDRIVARKLNGTFASITKGFAIEQPTARVIVDKSIAFSSNGWTTAFNGNQETW